MIQATSSVLATPATTTQVTKNVQETQEGFAAWLDQALKPAQEAQAAAQTEAMGLLTGETTSIHQMVLAAEKADVALRLTLQIRNKAMDAYNDIMRMQL